MILVRDIRLPLSQGEEQAKARALSILRLPEHKVRQMGVSRLSVDARHGRPKLVYTIAVTLKDEGEEPAYAGASPCVAFRQETPFCLTPGPERLRSRPVVCGLGPAGLFAALALAQQGFAPSCWSGAPPWKSGSGRWSIFPPPASWTRTPTSSLARGRGHLRTASSPPASATPCAAM